MNPTIFNQSPLFVDFLKSHPLISIRALEKKLGMSVGIIGHAMVKGSNRSIPKKWWPSLYLELKDYSFEYPQD